LAWDAAMPGDEPPHGERFDWHGCLEHKRLPNATRLRTTWRQSDALPPRLFSKIDSSKYPYHRQRFSLHKEIHETDLENVKHQYIIYQ